MSTGYTINDNDIDTIAEPSNNRYPYNLAGLDNYVCADGTTLASKLSRPSSSPWVEPLNDIPFKHYSSYSGTDVSPTLNAIGTVPLSKVNGVSTAFYTLTTLGDTSIYKASDGIHIGSAVFPYSSFRVQPKRIGVIFCGGGGGACGMGVSAGDKYGYNRAPSAGGGGGAIVGAVINLDESCTIHLGGGGAGGTDVDHSGQKSDGAAGGQSYLTNRGITIYANGGGGSHDSIGSSGYTIQAGICGDGGTVTGSTSDSYITLQQSGVAGNDWYNSQRGGNSITTSFSSIEISSTLYSNSNTDCYASSSDAYRAAHFGGGSSIGQGGNEGTAPGYGGGGSTKSKNGGQGCAIFFY